MEAENIFQEKPRDTAACTLVNDSPDTQKIRNQIKSHIDKLLKPKPTDYEIVENESSYMITQRFAPKPAIMVVRLRSYRKAMALFAYNSFEIFHGDCRIVNMKIRNDTDDKKLFTYVKNAIKTFKEQADFSKELVKEYKKKHTEQIKKEKNLSKKLVSIYKEIGVIPDKDGKINAFSNNAGYGNKGKVKADILKISKCSHIVYVPKSVKDPESIYEEITDKADRALEIQYENISNMWIVKYIGSNDDIIELYNIFKKGIQYKARVDKKMRKYRSLPQISVNSNTSYYEQIERLSLNSVFNMKMTTSDVAKIIKSKGLKIWKLYLD